LDFFQYVNVPRPKEYEFGWNRGNPNHFISRYEQNKEHKFRTRVICSIFIKRQIRRKKRERGDTGEYMIPAKNLGGGGVRVLRKVLGAVKKFHEILQQICENHEGWSKNFQKFFWPNFPIFGPNFFRGGGGYRLRIFSGGG
jgi:hypothetical protein